MVSEADLHLVLSHCRALLDAAEELVAAGSRRGIEIAEALAVWHGPHGRTFRDRVEAEATDLRLAAAGLRREADAWAQVWADTVNHQNRQAHEAKVAEIAGARSVGERFVDLFVGDDSAEQIAELEAVATPVAGTRYAATGGLVRW